MITSGCRRTTSSDVDDALLAELGVAQLGEDRVAAGDLHQLFDPPDAGDQRVVPFLEEDARPDGSRAAAARIASSSSSRCETRRSARAGAADQSAEDADHLQDLGDAALVEHHHRVAALDQLGGDVGLQVGEAEDQVGLERLDLVVTRVDERRHARLRRASGGRTV